VLLPEYNHSVMIHSYYVMWRTKHCQELLRNLHLVKR